MYVDFNTPMWTRGNFPSVEPNGTEIVDPWAGTGNDNTPFDQEFYLILDVNVGGTNGWFPDNQGSKPWMDASANAMKDFYGALDLWYATWTSPKMVISNVQIWQQCNGNEDL